MCIAFHNAGISCPSYLLSCIRTFEFSYCWVGISGWWGTFVRLRSTQVERGRGVRTQEARVRTQQGNGREGLPRRRRCCRCFAVSWRRRQLLLLLLLILRGFPAPRSQWSVGCVGEKTGMAGFGRLALWGKVPNANFPNLWGKLLNLALWGKVVIWKFLNLASYQNGWFFANVSVRPFPKKIMLHFWIFIEAIFDHENMTKHAKVNVSPETHKFFLQKRSIRFFWKIIHFGS